MALEIREIVIRAVAGMTMGGNKKKDDEDGCEEDKDSKKKQETIDQVVEIIRNTKER